MSHPAKVSAKPTSIPVIVDVPRPDPRLGFDAYVEALAAAIVGGNPAQYTVGLYGPWGTGKSSILLALKAKLKSLKDPPTVIVFDAWRHERAESFLGPLLWTVQEALSAGNRREKVKKALGGLEITAFGIGMRIPHQATPSPSVEAYMESMRSLEALGSDESGHRIVVMVDDLDRCSPTRVIEVIESIRLLMDMPGFVFLLAIDYDALIRAVAQKYPALDAHQFVEKIVQVPFRIPQGSEAPKDYVHQVVQDWVVLRPTWFDGVDDEDISSIGTLALRGNPRQLKRVLNSFMVARHIDWAGFASSDRKSSVLLACLALQLRWPEEFDNLVDEVGRYLRGDGRGVPRPVLGAVHGYKEWLTRELDTDDARDFKEFLDRHLHKETSVNLLGETLQLASEVSSGDSTVLTGTERRDQFVRDVLAIAGESDRNFVVRQNGDSVAVLAGDEVVLRIDRLRSVPQEFEVWLADSIAERLTMHTPATSRKQKGGHVFDYKAEVGRPLGDVLDDASALVEQVRYLVLGEP